MSLALSQRGAPVCQARLPAAGGASVEALAWAGGRLFSTGLHGHLLEHGGHGLEATASTAVTGGAAWCLSADPARCRLAAGTEDGQVVIHTVTDRGLVFDCRLSKQVSLCDVCYRGDCPNRSVCMTCAIGDCPNRSVGVRCDVGDCPNRSVCVTCAGETVQTGQSV